MGFKYPYEDICLDCAKVLDGRDAGVCGIWTGVCPLCQETKKLAAAVHDFGLNQVDQKKFKALKNK